MEINEQPKKDIQHKVCLSVDSNIANQLIQMKQVGDTYNDIIKRLLDNYNNKR
jgi:hypothetical protein